MIAATNSRTAIVITLGEMFLLVVSMFVVRRKDYIKNVLTIFVITIIAFSFNLVNFKNFLNDSLPNNSKIVVNSASSYVSNNITNVVDTTSRSNNARYCNLIANINTIIEYPVMGVGSGFKDAYINRNLPEFSYNNYEIRNWSRFMHIKGVLNSGFSEINLYANIAIQNGIVGLTLYLSVPLYLMYRILKSRTELINDKRSIMLVIATAGLMVAGLSGNAFVILNGIVWGLLYCKISELGNKKSPSCDGNS